MKLLVLFLIALLPLQASGQCNNTQDDWSGGPVVQAPDWFFENCFFSSDSIHWQSADTLRLQDYAGGFPDSGELTSSIIIIPMPTDYEMWGNLFWTADTPYETAVEFYIRASTDWENMGSWYGPFTESPTDLSAIMPVAMDYLQYKVVLSSDNPDSTPVLYSVTIEASHPGSVDENSAGASPSGTLGTTSNPGYGSFTVILPEGAEGQTVTVYNMSGRVVAELKDQYLVNDLPPGVYTCVSEHPETTGLVRVVLVR